MNISTAVPQHLLRRLALVTLVGWLGTPGHSAPTPAGTPIGNQATATYTDGTGVTREVTSNPVVTFVQQVASLSLTADGTTFVAPGGQAVYPHTLTNTGNGTDSFAFSVANLGGSDDFDLTGLVLYADADGNGQPDNFTPITTTGPLAAGGVFRFVAVGSVPGSQANGDTAAVQVTATSVFDGGVTGSNTDTTTVTDNAVIAVTKSFSASSGTDGSGPYTITLEYTNTGNDTATDLTLTDAIPSGMTYVAASGKWSGSASALTDPVAGDPAGVNYDFNETTAGTVTAVIAAVAPGVSGTLSFQVTVNADVTPGPINNTAQFAYDPDGPGSEPPTSPEPSNTATFNVTLRVSVAIDDNPLQPGDVTLDDVVTVPSAIQGATVVFSNQVHNVSNGTNSFDIALSGSTFPAGTTFGIFRSDGVTTLQNSGGSSDPDTGLIPPNGSYTVVVKAFLPAGANGNNGGSGFDVTVTATLTTSSSVSDTVTDHLDAIVANTVDVTNGAPLPGGSGSGTGPEASAVTTNDVNPGATTRFTLFVNNTSSQPDTFGLAASTNATFSTIGLPAGWTVQFRNSAETIITGTGSVASNASFLVFADVTVPAGTGPGQVSLYFRALSATSGAVDMKHDAVAVNRVRSITLSPNNTGQVQSPGSVVYSHTIANAGNVLEGDGVVSSVALGNSDDQTGWSSVIYFDLNNDGLLDVGDPSVTDLSFLSNGSAGLAPGESVTLFVKVFAPSGSAVGTVNTTTLSATTTNGSYGDTVPGVASVTDQSTVAPADLVMTKQQALDADCDGTPENAYATANLTTGAVPGACIRYRIIATNTGTNDVTSVVITDATPTYTTYSATVPAATTVGSVGSVPADGATGTLQFNVGTLSPGQTVTNTFGVKIDE